jgi:protein-S-isoprenylcysteine O-methyltransferase Ste14
LTNSYSPNSRPSCKGRLLYTLFFVVYFAASLACLRQWSGPHPWSRLDRFSGGYLLISLFWMLAAGKFLRLATGAKEIAAEISGKSYDPWTLIFTMLLPIAELTVFLDYGHWHLMSALAQPALQWAGLALSLAGALLLLWTDRQLLAHFAGDMTRRGVIETGPYRFVRHPRYLSLLLSRVAFALALASPPAWAFALLWFLVLARRIHLEEAHLRKIFCPDYAAYVRRTSRLLPGVF